MSMPFRSDNVRNCWPSWPAAGRCFGKLLALSKPMSKALSPTENQRIREAENAIERERARGEHIMAHIVGHKVKLFSSSHSQTPEK